MMYVALIVLDHLRGVDDLHEIAFTDAETERQAVKNLMEMEWPRDYWVSGKSICRIKTIMMMDKGDPFFNRRFASAVGSAMDDNSTPKKTRKRIKHRTPASFKQGSTKSGTKPTQPRRRLRKKKK